MDRERDEPPPHPTPSEIDHELQVQRAFLESTRLPTDLRDAHLSTLPATFATEVRDLLASLPPDHEADTDAHEWHGRPIGHWTLGVEIGAGGQGRVFKAVDRQGRKAAVKVLHATRSDMILRLDREVEALQSLHHPGIVTVLDHGVASDHRTGKNLAYVAIDLLEDAEPLLDWAARTRPDREARLDLLEQVLTALAHAHGRGVVHRDLKSSNILVDDAGIAHLIDFGIARLTDPEGGPAGLHPTETRDHHAIVGSLVHLAPEQVDKQLGPVSPAIDVHAVGLLAYRLLCGEPPYDATGSVVQAIQAVLHVPPADPTVFDPEMPRDIADWMLTCLEKHPDQRPVDAGVALSLLRETRRRHLDSHQAGHETGEGHGPRVAVVTMIFVAVFAAAIIATTLFPGGDSDTRTDPTINQTTRPNPGAGDTDMRSRPFLGAVVGGAMMTGGVCAQDAVQWRIGSGGNGHWYRLDSGNIPWETAATDSESKGGHLVTITSQSENDFIEPLIPEYECCWNVVWAGGVRDTSIPDPSSGWSWITGEAFEFTNWYVNQRNGEEFLTLGRNDGPLTWGDYDSPDPDVDHWMTEWSADCNGDGIVDYGQILDGTFDDDDVNGIPDCCDLGETCRTELLFWNPDQGGNGHWYGLFVTDGITWNASRTAAESMGGRLVSLETLAEYEFVVPTFASQPDAWSRRSNYDRGPWVGGYQELRDDQYSEPLGGWYWLSGERIDPDFFSSIGSNPNNFPCCEDFLQIGETFLEPGLNDLNENNATISFVVEWSDDCNDDGVVDFGQIRDGVLLDQDENGVPDECERCTGDIDGSGVVDAADLEILIAVWNTSGKINPEADIDASGTVDGTDLGLLFMNWGGCP